MLNNPIRYNDPSGHRDSGECGPGENCDRTKRPQTWEEAKKASGKEDENYQQTSIGLNPSTTIPAQTIIGPALHNTYNTSSNPLPWEINPNEPDYLAYTISFENVSAVLTVDRYQNAYLGFGGNAGRGMLILGFAKTEGKIFPGRIASERTSQNFLLGPSINFGAAAIIGKAQTTPLLGDSFSSNEDLSYAIL